MTAKSPQHRLYVYRVKSKEQIQKGRSLRAAESFIKIGMTSQVKIADRFDLYPDGFVEFYSRSLLTSQKFETRKHLFEVEQTIHRALRKYRYYPRHKFSGHTECYVATPESRKLIKSLIWAARITHTPGTKVLKAINSKTKDRAVQAVKLIK